MMGVATRARRRSSRDKSQAVRLLDVFVYGPFMLGVGLAAATLHPAARLGLAALGVGTIVYNARNYLRVDAGDALRLDSAANGR